MKRATLFALVLTLSACPSVKDEDDTTDDGARESATGTTSSAPEPKT